MPEIVYRVSDLQQRTNEATIHDMNVANNLLSDVKEYALMNKQRLSDWWFLFHS